MTVIEHSILIPTAVENVWQMVSNIDNNALWLADCRSIAFLTSYKQGRGARWRHTNEGGRDYVIEITDWYERVGYRYTIVNGTPYASNFGVIRLQETPEGTIVQWTFEYTLSGFLSGVRNTITVKRGVETNIIHSLQMLYKQVNKSKMPSAFTPKSLMQDAPDAEARAHYKPRHPSLFVDSTDESDLSGQIYEPPISDEDTKERPALVDVSSEEIQTEAAFDVSQLSSLSDTSQKEDIDEHPTVEAEVFVDSSVDNDMFELPRLSDDGETLTDSGRLSVFEIFGVPKPSETQQMKAVEVSTQVQPLVSESKLVSVDRDVVSSDDADVSGLRVRLRKKNVSVRRKL